MINNHSTEQHCEWKFISLRKQFLKSSKTGVFYHKWNKKQTVATVYTQERQKIVEN